MLATRGLYQASQCKIFSCIFITSLCVLSFINISRSANFEILKGRLNLLSF
nr:MAG TPA: hypothetical protein [Caudoviricetes sp.]